MQHKAATLQWFEDWNWILSIAALRNWDTSRLIIKPPVTLHEVENIQRKIKVHLPKEFIDVLTNYSSEVRLSWQIKREETEGIFSPIFCGGGGISEYRNDSYLWSFEKLEGLYETYAGWLRDCYSDPEDPYGKHYYSKTPFLEVPNGDLIVFDQLGQVVYLSHDDGPLHGMRLATNFVEFISAWSATGCVGTESEQMQVFYDREMQRLHERHADVVQAWTSWLSTTDRSPLKKML